MSSNDRKKIFLAAALFVIALIVALFTIGHANPRPQEYFLDLSTGRLFPADLGRHPPITAPSGSQGVRAYVVSCDGSCSAAQRQIAYLETYDEKVLPLLTQDFATVDQQQAAALQIQRGLRYAVLPITPAYPFQPAWLPDGSPAAEQLILRFNSFCSGARPTLCRP